MCHRLIRFNLALLVLVVTPSLGLAAPASFSAAKRIAKQIYAQHRVTFYCHCTYKTRGSINLKACGYHIRKNARRAHRIEWEHIVPAWAFGHTLACWQKPLCHKRNGRSYKGRQCCNRINPHFKRMQADLMNLVPAIGEVNGDRSNFMFTQLPNTRSPYGACSMLINTTTKRVQPPPYTRGFIARTYLYMHNTYGLPISPAQMSLFTHWDQRYPPPPGN